MYLSYFLLKRFQTKTVNKSLILFVFKHRNYVLKEERLVDLRIICDYLLKITINEPIKEYEVIKVMLQTR